MNTIIKLTINGDPYELYIDSRRSLLDVLRNDVGLKGSHRGCNAGDCGACTVMRNGFPVTACMILAADCEGDRILTIEGLTVDGTLHPLQQAMIEKGAIQCGFCTPGIVMNAIALLEENPRPSEIQVRRALAGNLCRCTGYVKVVEAVLSLSEESG